MVTIYTITAIFAIFVQAFFTATEMAFTTVDKVKLDLLVKDGDKHAIRLKGLFSGKDMFLGTTLVGTNIAVIISTVMATRIFTEYFGTRYASLIATTIMVPLTLVFAEIIPKMIAREFSMPLALSFVIPIKTFSKLFSPVILFVNSAASLLISPLLSRLDDEHHDFTKKDIKKMLKFDRQNALVEADEIDLIHKVMDLGTKTVGDIMIPLYRMSSLEIEDTAGDLKKLVSLSGFSRIPIYERSKNNIVGIVNVYDILFNIEWVDEDTKLKELMREVINIKPTDGLDIALARLRHKRQPMGIVLSTEAKVVGLITIEDILEELVGNIEDKG